MHAECFTELKNRWIGFGMYTLSTLIYTWGQVLFIQKKAVKKNYLVSNGVLQYRLNNFWKTSVLQPTMTTEQQMTPSQMQYLQPKLAAFKYCNRKYQFVLREHFYLTFISVYNKPYTGYYNNIVNFNLFLQSRLINS